MFTNTVPIDSYRLPTVSQTIGFSIEATIVKDNFNVAVNHFFNTIYNTPLVGKFTILSSTWKKNTINYSSLDQIVSDMSYLEIIALGKDVLPYIFQEMIQEPDYWFSALQAIVGINPIRPEHRGDLQAMTNDWLDWGKLAGYVA